MGAEERWKFLRWIHAGDAGEKKTAAERDIRRLKLNWLFVAFIRVVGAINYSCPLPTNHQFIINPTADSLNNLTNENIEPGLQQSESFYSLTYSVYFMGHTTAAITSGLIFNLVPTWYLFLVTILSHTVGYLLYALCTNAWMMLVARGLAGIALGLEISASFAYFGVSCDKYAENLKILGKFEEKKAARVKGFVFGTVNVADAIGFLIGGGFPILLAQFPDCPQFRPPGWLCVAVGVVLFLLQLALFRGECECRRQNTHSTTGISDDTNVGHWKELLSCVERKNIKWTERFCTVFLPLYIILVGGVKGACYVLPEVLLNPIVSDSFGFSEEDTTYFSIVIFVGAGISSVLIFTILYFKLGSYILTVTGLACTIVGLLVMTDWQAIPHDPCTDHSLFHHPELAHLYRDLAAPKLCIPHLNNSEIGMLAVQQSVYYSQEDVNAEVKHRSQASLTCTPVDSCPIWSHSHTAVNLISHVDYTTSNGMCLNHIHTNAKMPIHNMDKLNHPVGNAVLCTYGQNSSSFCSTLESQNDTLTLSLADQSLLAEAHIQSLQVVEKAVYQKAVSECVSAGEHCHWIPDSRVTHKHCSDCQPICRSTRHTLNFVQFTIGLALFLSTLSLLYIGVFLLLSNSVKKSFQGVSIGSLATLMGIVRITAPLWLDDAYEKAKKRTYLPMLILVALFLPLLGGLLLLYPWLGGQRKIEQQQLQDKEEDDEHTKLIPSSESRDSDDN